MLQKDMSKIIITENDIKEMVNSVITQLMEGTNYDTLYHFTCFSALLKMIETRRLNTSDTQRYNRNGNNYMSLTRHKSNLEGFSKPNSCNVRIELDMKRINSEHSIENVYPFEYYSPNRLKNYFSNRKTDPISAKQAHLNLKNNIKFTSYHDEEYYNQAEESLETPDDVYYIKGGFSFYVKRIDVISDNEENIKKLKETCLKYDYPVLEKIFIYFNDRDFSYQTSNYIQLKNFEHLPEGTLILPKSDLTKDEINQQWDDIHFSHDENKNS